MAQLLLLFIGILFVEGMVVRLSSLTIPTRVPPVLGSEVDVVLIFIPLMFAVTAYWMLDPLDIWPVGQPPSNKVLARLAPRRSRSWLGRRPSRPALAKLGAMAIRRHIRSRLEYLLLLYRAEIAARTFSANEEATLVRCAEDTVALRDSLPPKLTIPNMLGLPTIIVSFLVGLGFWKKRDGPGICLPYS